jgi:hypothetical protein
MDFLDALAETKRLSAAAREFASRQLGVFLGIISNTTDPLQLGRVRATTADKGGLIESDYALKVLPCPGWNPPSFVPGQTALLANLNGDPHNRVYLGALLNATNPLPPKPDPTDDLRIIPGSAVLGVGRNMIIEAGESITLKVGNYQLIISSQGLSVAIANGELTPTIQIAVDDEGFTFTANSTVFTVTTAGVKAQGTDLIGIGSVDSRGDVNVTKGY